MSRKAFVQAPSALHTTDRQARPFRLAPVAAAAAIVGLLVSASAHAAEAADKTTESTTPTTTEEAPALDAVTVRSRNRIEKLQDVPLSISVVQGAELTRQAATGVEEITKRAGNVSWNQGNQRTSSLSIRGIGKMGQTEAQDPSVGIIVDGVSYAYNALTSSFDFVDIDTVEVSRGPQGTLLGKNTSVGNIIFNTRKPSFTPTADYGLVFRGSDGLQAYAAVGGPLIDDVLAWRGTFSVSRAPGDVVNQYNKDFSYGNKDRVSGRVQFLYRPSDDFNALVRLEQQPRAAEATNGRTYNSANTHTYTNGAAVDVSGSADTKLARRWFSQDPGYTVNDYYNSISTDSARGLVSGSRGASAELNWQLAGHTLTSITAYKDYHFDAVNDEGTPFDISRNSGGYWNDYKQTSEELRLSSKTGGFVDYQAGLYYIHVNNSATYNQVYGNDAGAWFANATQYSLLDADAAGRYLLANSLANLKMGTRNTAGVQAIDNTSTAVFAQANWHLDTAWTLTTGARITREDRKNLGSSVILDNGNAAELNPVAINGVSLGGFDPASTDPTQVALANATALKYFGVSTYSALSATQKKQLAAAKAIRLKQMGVLFSPTEAEPYRATQPTLTLSPSYKFNPDVTGYFSFQHGEKAGISQFFNGESYLVKAEKTNNFELGVKSALLNKTLIFNADMFLSKIRDYQQTSQLLDTYTTALNVANGTTPTTAYGNITGNIPKVKVYGLEVDGVYAGIPRTTLRFAGAYNRAVYESFPNAAFPAEETNLAGKPDNYKDISGRTLPGAPKYTFNVGADYHQPVFGDKEVHTSVNLAATSGYISDTAMSAYSWISKNYTVDWSVGVGKLNKSFDVSLLVKNALGNDTPQSKTWTSVTPAVPRSVAVQFTGRL